MNYTMESFTRYCDNTEVATEGVISDAVKSKIDSIKKKYQKRYFDMSKKGLTKSLVKYNNVLREVSKVAKDSNRESAKEELEKLVIHSKELYKRINAVDSVKEVNSIHSDIERSINHAIRLAKTFPNYTDNRTLVSMIRNNEMMNAMVQQNTVYQQMFDQQNQLAIQEQQRVVNQMNQQMINQQMTQQAIDNAVRASQPMAFGGYMPNSAFGMF